MSVYHLIFAKHNMTLHVHIFSANTQQTSQVAVHKLAKQHQISYRGLMKCNSVKKKQHSSRSVAPAVTLLHCFLTDNVRKQCGDTEQLLSAQHGDSEGLIRTLSLSFLCITASALSFTHSLTLRLQLRYVRLELIENERF